MQAVAGRSRAGSSRALAGLGRAFVVSLGIVLGGAGVSGAQAPEVIDVTKQADARIAVGVGDFPAIASDRVGSPPGQVLAFDLELSGWFEAKRPGLLPPQTLNDWGRLGAEVVTEMRLEGEDLLGGLRDAGSGELLFERRYAPSVGSLRTRIHHFATDLVLALTGERGLALTQILCEWNDGNGKRIVLMDVDGYRLRPLSGEEELEVGPRWTADGRSAVYTSYSSGYPDVYLHDLKLGSRERVAHYEGLNAQGDLSPDGTHLLASLSFSGNPEICSKDLTSGKIRRLTDHPATDASPAWSPDGRQVVFVSDRSGSPQIWRMDADGENVERLTVRGSYNTAPDWSPDGTRIAYCAVRPDGFQIQVLDLRTQQVTTVTEGGGCEDPSWSPDGRSILYSRKAGGRTDLYITNLNERRAIRVTRGSGTFTGPDWSPYR